MSGATCTLRLSAINPLNDKRTDESGGKRMSLNRREMLRLGALGAAGAVISSAASSQMVPGLLAPQQSGTAYRPLAPTAPQQPVLQSAPAGIDAQLFQRAK